MAEQTRLTVGSATKQSTGRWCSDTYACTIGTKPKKSLLILRRQALRALVDGDGTKPLQPIATLKHVLITALNGLIPPLAPRTGLDLRAWHTARGTARDMRRRVGMVIWRYRNYKGCTRSSAIG